MVRGEPFTVHQEISCCALPGMRAFNKETPRVRYLFSQFERDVTAIRGFLRVKGELNQSDSQGVDDCLTMAGAGPSMGVHLSLRTVRPFLRVSNFCKNYPMGGRSPRGRMMLIRHLSVHHSAPLQRTFSYSARPIACATPPMIWPLREPDAGPTNLFQGDEVLHLYGVSGQIYGTSAT